MSNRETPSHARENAHINQAARATAARLIERLRQGEITTFQLEDDWPNGGKDVALPAVETMLWNFYSESEPLRLTDRHAPDPGVALLFDRCALFLKTSLPYEWEESNFAPPGNLNTRVAAAAGMRTEGAIQALASWEIWPFRRPEDLDSTKQT